MDENIWKQTKLMEIPEEALRQTLENEKSMTEKLYALVKRSPFAVAGLTGLSIICGIGVYKWKTKTVNPSIYLTQLRVAAQATALSIIGLGMIYSMYNDFILKKKKE
ncbi:HIG1 domain family member 1A, mitochondrial-like [Apis laboriosa]|uniref:HIG1 domain family member 1A, mitochondrial-like n=1 Tax=Apis laboriosa TaxID=183418 RepID=UPI001CC6A3DB|nr:HIG1 domain family member 1A, mitochondrial-like [Apis laboriosa]XP_043794349.1 HIG1 domain family member 1A, mitochondrial-like [Apis laboriosa]